jgi:DNA-binding GntR family transcriptional regulator
VLRSLDEVSNQHRPLVEAIRSGTEDEAGRLLAAHAEHAGDLIAELVAVQTVNG